MSKIYLGDSVYIDYRDGQFILTTENGKPTDPSNEIILEHRVMEALELYLNAKKISCEC